MPPRSAGLIYRPDAGARRLRGDASRWPSLHNEKRSDKKRWRYAICAIGRYIISRARYAAMLRRRSAISGFFQNH